jgi:excisionase family DNA binding protein
MPRQDIHSAAPEPTLFTVAQVARQWSVSVDTVRKLIRCGALVAVYIGPVGRRPIVRISAAEMQRAVRSNGNGHA